MRRWIMLVLAAILVPPGTLAALHVIGRDSDTPAVRFTVVVGRSMEPTFHEGDGVVFARLKWRPGDVVLADVGERYEVVKRVDKTEEDYVHLVGDNKAKSATYWIKSDQVIGRLMLRFGRFKRMAETVPKAKPVVQP